tara:strand:- start:787 stop:966 length:180 start_codon:yes stop_codon:yes gene_type:complete
MTPAREKQIRLLRGEGAQAFRDGRHWQSVSEKYGTPANPDYQQWLRGYREATYEARRET